MGLCLQRTRLSFACLIASRFAATASGSSFFLLSAFFCDFVSGRCCRSTVSTSSAVLVCSRTSSSSSSASRIEYSAGINPSSASNEALCSLIKLCSVSSERSSPRCLGAAHFEIHAGVDVRDENDARKRYSDDSGNTSPSCSRFSPALSRPLGACRPGASWPAARSRPSRSGLALNPRRQTRAGLSSSVLHQLVWCRVAWQESRRLQCFCSVRERAFAQPRPLQVICR